MTKRRLRDTPANRLPYHVNQMIESDLIKGTVRPRSDRGRRVLDDYFVEDITPLGHQMIARYKSNTVWRQVKEHFQTKGVALSLDLLVQIAIQKGKEALGLSGDGTPNP